MLQFKQSETTAARRRMLVRLVDATDLSTPETGVTVAAGDLKISKNGAAEANHAGTWTEIGGGDYYYEFTSGELDTFGFIRLRIAKTGIAPASFFGQVEANDPYTPITATVPTLLQGTAQSGTASTITFPASASAVNDVYNGAYGHITGGTGANQNAFQVLDYDGTTKIATVYIAGPPEQGRQFTITPDSTSVFSLHPFPIQPIPLNHANGVLEAKAVDAIQAFIAKFATLDSGQTFSGAHAASIVKLIALNSAGASLTLSDIAAAVWDRLLSLHTIPGSAGAGVKVASGTITSVQNLAPGSILSTSFAAGAIDQAALNATAVSAIQSGLATAAALAAVAADLPLRYTRGVAARFMFVMRDSTNHAPAPGKTVSAFRSLDGAAFAACANAVVEIAVGWYYIDLATTDLDAVEVGLRFTATGCDDSNYKLPLQPT